MKRLKHRANVPEPDHSLAHRALEDYVLAQVTESLILTTSAKILFEIDLEKTQKLSLAILDLAAARGLSNLEQAMAVQGYLGALFALPMSKLMDSLVDDAQKSILASFESTTKH